MLWMLIAMFCILVVAGVVALYVAYPHRGEEVPRAPWLGDAMNRAAESIPTVDNPRVDEPQDVRDSHETGSAHRS